MNKKNSESYIFRYYEMKEWDYEDTVGALDTLLLVAMLFIFVWIL